MGKNKEGKEETRFQLSLSVDVGIHCDCTVMYGTAVIAAAAAAFVRVSAAAEGHYLFPFSLASPAVGGERRRICGDFPRLPVPTIPGFLSGILHTVSVGVFSCGCSPTGDSFHFMDLMLHGNERASNLGSH